MRGPGEPLRGSGGIVEGVEEGGGAGSGGTIGEGSFEGLGGEGMAETEGTT